MEDLLKKETVKRVIKALNKFDQSLKVEALKSSARTAKEAAESLNCEVGAIVKSLFLRTKNSFLLCLVAGDKRCSLNKIKKILGEKDVSMGSADQVKEITGFTIGVVSPVETLAAGGGDEAADQAYEGGTTRGCEGYERGWT